MKCVLYRSRISGALPLSILILCLFGCVEGPPGKDGADGYGQARDSIILDFKSAWEFNYSRYPNHAVVLELSDAEQAAYRLADTTLLRRDSLPIGLFAAAKYAPREWVAFYELANQIGCDQDSAIPPDWIARFVDTASIEQSYFCVDRGLPFSPVRGNPQLQYYDGKGFDIGSFFTWERIPIGNLRIYYW
jgi:hypothetical protein